MNARKLICVVSMCLAAMLLGCDEGGGGDSEPIEVGTITSLTGDLSSLGPCWRDAVALAVQESNAAGGALEGRQMELNVEDDRTTADGGGAAAKTLVDMGVVGVIGAPASSSTSKAVEITGPAKVPQISGTSTSPVLNSMEGGEDAHPFFFRTVPADHLQGVVIANAAAGEYNDPPDFELTCTRLAIINLDNDYGNPFGDAVAERYEALGNTVVVDIDYAEGQPNYTTEVQNLIDQTPDCIALIAYPDTGSAIVRGWYDEGGDANVQWLGTDGLKNEFMDDIPAEAANGFLGSAPAVNSAAPTFRAYVDAYEAAFPSCVDEDRMPLIFSDAIYDGAALLVLAIAHAGTLDGDAVRESLFSVARFESGDENFGPGELVQAIAALQGGRSINYEGAAGGLEFLDNGDVVADYEVWRYNGATFDSVATADADDLLDIVGG